MNQSHARATTIRPAAFRDGFGERRRMADATGIEKLEVLCLRRELVTADSFESALRDRANRLASFRHASFARVRTIERLSDPAQTLVLVSEPSQGARLSELLRSANEYGLRLDGSAEWCLVKQLVAAVCNLHKHAPDAAHGAIALERLVITPSGNVVIVEHVLGGALEQLRFSPERFWKELRVACPPAGVTTQFDQRADITQVGVVALSVILGRPLTDDEYPAAIEDLVVSAWEMSEAIERKPAPAGLRSWLARALQLDARQSFTSAIEANWELDKAIVESGYMLAPSDLEAFFALCQEPPAEPRSTQSVASPSATAARKPTPVPAKPTASLKAVPAPAKAVQKPEAKPQTPRPAAPAPFAKPERKSPDVKANASKPPLSPEPQAARPEIQPLEPQYSESAADSPPPTGFLNFALSSASARNWRRTAAAAALLTVISGAGWAAANRFLEPRSEVATAPTTPPAAPAVNMTPVEAAPISTPIEPLGPPPGFIEVRTNPPGATVTVAGVRRGVTPLTISDLPPGRHTVLIESSSGSVTRSVTVESGATALLAAELTPPETTPATGSVSVSAPSVVEILENGRSLGTSQSGRITLPVGAHQLEIVNQALGYRITRTVQVASGANSPINLEFPKGTLALNAIPWAEVWVDGEKVGDTPIGNLPVSIGTHEVLFRNPDLGEQRITATVTLTAPTRLSVDLRKR